MKFRSLFYSRKLKSMLYWFIIFEFNDDILNHGTCVVLLCCKSHPHAANIKFQPNACSSCFKQYFPFLPGGYNIHITLLNPLPVLILVHDEYSPACWVSRKLRPKSKTIPCYTTDCFKSSCLQFVDTISKVNVSGSATWLPNCHATDIAPTWAVFSLSLSLPPQILPKSTSSWRTVMNGLEATRGKHGLVIFFGSELL